MSCCETPNDPAGAAAYFSQSARRYARKFRRRGLDAAQRHLAEALEAAGIRGASILEAGCGVGGLHLTLLQRGAASAVGVDLSGEMISAARRLATEMGMGERATHREGDIVTLRPAPDAADIVLLDKVVCCYADLNALLGATLARARSLYALSHPRPVLRVGFRCMNFVRGLVGSSFAPHWHDWEAMRAAITAAGFDEVAERRTFAWSVHVYRRR